MTAADLAALWAAAESDPRDDGRKLVLADACADAGDPAAERALRWCVANGKWPDFARANPRGAWGWFGAIAHNSAVVFPPYLPERVWMWFLGGVAGGGDRGYRYESMGYYQGPFPWCRDDDIAVVVRRLGLALEWAEAAA